MGTGEGLRGGAGAGLRERAGRINIGDLPLEAGGVLRDATVGYRLWGALSPTADNVVVLPSYFSGTAASYRPWAEGLFDLERLCVVAYDQLGAGESSRPSACGGLGLWPACSVVDSVRAARLMLRALGVRHVRLVCGWSMGGMQAFAWQRLFPGDIDAAVAVCATPEPSAVNRVFLEGVRSVLVPRPGDETGLQALPASQLAARLGTFGRVYAGWAYSDEFFLSGEYRSLGYASPEDVLEGWAHDHEAMDAQDLVAQLDAWLRTRTAPRPVEATLVPSMTALPCSTDRYFLPGTLEDAREAYPNLRVRVIPSTLGHIAGRPGVREAETAFIAHAIRDAMEATGPSPDFACPPCLGKGAEKGPGGRPGDPPDPPAHASSVSLGPSTGPVVLEEAS